MWRPVPIDLPHVGPCDPVHIETAVGYTQPASWRWLESFVSIFQVE